MYTGCPQTGKQLLTSARPASPKIPTLFVHSLNGKIPQKVIIFSHLPTLSSPSSHSPSDLSPRTDFFIMLFRAAWARQAAPLRRQAFAPLARRSVTTDAASSHAENIPQVR